jgi:hypothetical protein
MKAKPKTLTERQAAYDAAYDELTSVAETWLEARAAGVVGRDIDVALTERVAAVRRTERALRKAAKRSI